MTNLEWLALIVSMVVMQQLFSIIRRLRDIDQVMRAIANRLKPRPSEHWWFRGGDEE